MRDILSLIGSINRPSFLVRTARFAAGEYSREQHLPRALKSPVLPRSGEALMRLMDIEAELNDLRGLNRAEYSFARHIDVLIALMGEAHLYRMTLRGPESGV